MRSILFFMSALAFAQSSIVIDAGSANDQYFEGGAVWGPLTSGYESLSDQNDEWRDLRYGAKFRYVVPVPNGHWRVRLQLMENRSTNTGPNTRVFTIAVNGSKSVPLDLFARHGSQQRGTLDLFAVVNDGKLVIDFQATKGNAVVSGIVLSPLGLIDLGTGTEDGGSLQLSNGKYIDVHPDTLEAYKVKNHMK